MAASAAQVLCTGLFTAMAIKSKSNGVKAIGLGLGALSVAALGIFKFLKKDVTKQSCQIMHFGWKVDLIQENQLKQYGQAKTGQLEAMGVKIQLDKSYSENFPRGCLSEILRPVLVKLNLFENHYISSASKWLDNLTGVAKKIDNLSKIK